MTDGPLPFDAIIQVRDVLPDRVARLLCVGPPTAIAAAIDRLTQFALEEGIGPCGPPVAVFACLSEQPASGEETPDIEVEVRVPIRRVLPDGAIETMTIPRSRCACVTWTGPLDASFRQVHFALFAWMDSRGLPRAGTTHEHSYLAGAEGAESPSIEVRVPIVGSQAPLPAL